MNTDTLDIAKIQEQAEKYQDRISKVVSDILSENESDPALGPSVLAAVSIVTARFAGQVGIDRGPYLAMMSEAYSNANNIEEEDPSKLDEDNLFRYYGEKIRTAINEIMGTHRDPRVMSALAQSMLAITARLHAFAPRMSPELFGKMCRNLMIKVFNDPEIKQVREKITPKIIT